MKTPAIKIPTRQQGFTLIELVIGLFLSLLVVGSILAVYVPSLSTYKKTNAMSILQESERYAIDTLNRSVQQAGYKGCNSASNFNFVNTVDFNNASIPPALENWAYTNRPIRGFSANSGSIAGTFGSAFDNDMLEHGGSKIGDILMLTYGVETNLVVDSHDLANEIINFQGDVASALQPGMILQMNNCEHQAVAFQINDSAAPVYDSINDITPVDYSAANTKNCTAYEKDEFDVLQDTNKVYLGGGVGASCADVPSRGLFDEVTYRQFMTGTQSVSTAYYLRDDPGNNIPTLYRVSTATGGNPEQLLEGVENMRVMYGVDNTGNSAVDQYVTAATLNAAPNNWANVRTIKITLLIRSLAGKGESDAIQNFSFPDISGTFVDCSGTSPDGQACPGFIYDDFNSQSSARRVVEKVFSVRNSFL